MDAGIVYPLFCGLATQNPIDQEGTYPLPSATRSLHVQCAGRLSQSGRRAGGRAAAPRATSRRYWKRRSSGESLLELAHVVANRHYSGYGLGGHANCEIDATGRWSSERVRALCALGAGPRASQYMVLGAKARRPARRAAPSCAARTSRQWLPRSAASHEAHFQAEAEGTTVEQIIQEIIHNVDSTLQDSHSREQIAKVLRS
ncbi:MAG: hypothetical protein R3C56_00225 [Pirellulaceae bacterium]